MLADAFKDGEFDASYIPIVMVGLFVVLVGLIIWWRQDMSFDGTYEPMATGTPFNNIQLR